MLSSIKNIFDGKDHAHGGTVKIVKIGVMNEERIALGRAILKGVAKTNFRVNNNSKKGVTHDL